MLFRVSALAIALLSSAPQTVPPSAQKPQADAATVRGPKLGSPDLVKLGPGVMTPRLAKEVKPNYPDAARTAGVEGIVTLEAVVLDDGTVGDIKVTKPLQADLDAEAVRTVRQWIFKPATRGGQAVPVAVEIEMQFSRPKS